MQQFKWFGHFNGICDNRYHPVKPVGIREILLKGGKIRESPKKTWSFEIIPILRRKRVTCVDATRRINDNRTWSIFISIDSVRLLCMLKRTDQWRKVYVIMCYWTRISVSFIIRNVKSALLKDCKQCYTERVYVLFSFIITVFVALSLRSSL